MNAIPPPAPLPQLDGPPPSAPGLGAGPQSPSFSGLAPATGQDANAGGGIQVVQLVLQTAQAVAQGMDVLAKIDPALMGLMSQLQEQLKAGVRSALQQGLSQSEPSPQSTFQGMGGGV